MFYLLLQNACSFGFTTVTIPALTSDTIIFGDHQLFFFVTEVSTSAQCTVIGDGVASQPFYPNISYTYQVIGSMMNCSSGSGPLSMGVLSIPADTCDKTIHLRSDNYINFELEVPNSTDSVCLFHFQPQNAYRTTINCTGLDRSDTCSFHKQIDLQMQRDPFPHHINATIEESIEDGFLLKIVPNAEEHGLSASTKVVLIKGNGKYPNCAARPVGILSVNGFEPGILPDEVIVECEGPEETVIVAIILVIVLVTAMVAILVIYRGCRPNRKAYRSDDSEPLHPRDPS